MPFARDSDVAKMWGHINDAAVAPSAVVPGLPPELDEVVLRAMAKDSAERYPSAGDLGRAALAAGGGQGAGRARADGRARRGVAGGGRARADDRSQAGDAGRRHSGRPGRAGDASGTDRAPGAATAPGADPTSLLLRRPPRSRRHHRLAARPAEAAGADSSPASPWSAVVLVLGVAAAVLAATGAFSSDTPPRPETTPSQASNTDTGPVDTNPPSTDTGPTRVSGAEARTLLRTYETAYTDHDPPALRRLFAPTFTRKNGNAPTKSLDAALAEYSQQFNQFPNSVYHLNILDVKPGSDDASASATYTIDNAGASPSDGLDRLPHEPRGPAAEDRRDRDPGGLMARLLLEIVEGPGAGRQLPLERPVVVGRDAAADVVLDDERVSRQHARITPQAGGAVVEDLDSRNGTFVNREEIHSPVTALPGDDVLLGTTVLELRTDAELATRPSVVRPVPPALAAPQREPTYVASPQPQGQQLLGRYSDTRVKAQARLAPAGHRRPRALRGAHLPGHEVDEQGDRGQRDRHEGQDGGAHEQRRRALAVAAAHGGHGEGLARRVRGAARAPRPSAGRRARR